MNTKHGKSSKRRGAVIFAIAAGTLGLALFAHWRIAVAQPPISQDGAAQDGTQAQQPPERVARLIRELGSESYNRRQAAGQQLKALGAASIMPLEAVKDSADPEVRIRATELLRELKLAAMWDATTVSLNAEDRSVAEVFAEIARQTGNTLALDGGNSGLNDMPVTVEFSQTPFWQAIDELCQKSSNHVAYFTGRRETRLGISRGLAQQPPIAYSGALRGQVLSVRREFSEQLDFTSTDSAQTHGFQLVVQVEWEEQFRMIAHRRTPKIIEAVTDNGEVLEVIGKPDAEWVIANGLNRRVKFTFELPPPTLAARRIARLRLGWEVAAVGDFGEVRIDNLANSQAYEQEDVQVTLQSRVIRPYQRQELQVRVDRSFPDWQPVEMFYNETDVRLLDADGKQLRLEQADWSRQSTGLNVRARFLGATAGPPKMLVVRYPRIRDKRELHLEFSNIPLPRSVPK